MITYQPSYLQCSWSSIDRQEIIGNEVPCLTVLCRGSRSFINISII
jgi:hypothetical protein